MNCTRQVKAEQGRAERGTLHNYFLCASVLVHDVVPHRKSYSLFPYDFLLFSAFLSHDQGGGYEC